jgi:hypothetical protein
MLISHFQDFIEGKMYTVYFKFDDSFSSVSGTFTGFVYLNNDGEQVRESDASEEVVCNGPDGVWLDDEAFLFDDISYTEKENETYDSDVMHQISEIIERTASSC